MSRTSALTRKPKGLGRRNFAQRYPRSLATPTPTSRSKGQKSRSQSQLVQRSEMCQYFANGYALQIWYAHRPWAVLAPNHKLAPKWAWPGVRDPISKFWEPINISQTEKATIFKFGMHIGCGQFLPPDHKLARNWAWPGDVTQFRNFGTPSIFRKR